MSTTREFCDYVLENLSRAAGDVKARRMMGEYCLYFRGKLVGLLCDNNVFLKETEISRHFLPNAERALPYEGSKTPMVLLDDLEDLELLRTLLEGAFEELPLPKKKGEKK